MDPMGYKSYFTWLSRYPYLQKCLSCGKWTSEAHEPSIFDAVRPTVSHPTSLLVQPIALEDKFFWPVEPSPSSTANGKETPGIAQILVDYHRPSKKGHKRGVSPIFRQTHMFLFFFFRYQYNQLLRRWSAVTLQLWSIILKQAQHGDINHPWLGMISVPPCSTKKKMDLGDGKHGIVLPTLDPHGPMDWWSPPGLVARQRARRRGKMLQPGANCWKRWHGEHKWRISG